MGTFVSSVARLLRIFVAVPVQGEHVLATCPTMVLELNSDPELLQTVEGRATDLITEAVPELQPVQGLDGSIRFMAQSVEREPPNDRPVFGQNMKPQRVVIDRSHSKHAHLDELALVCLSVVEKLFAKQTIETRNVDVQYGQAERPPLFPPHG
jgi:hypothetical protein